MKTYFIHNEYFKQNILGNDFTLQSLLETEINLLKVNEKRNNSVLIHFLKKYSKNTNTNLLLTNIT